MEGQHGVHKAVVGGQGVAEALAWWVKQGEEEEGAVKGKSMDV